MKYQHDSPSLQVNPDDELRSYVVNYSWHNLNFQGFFRLTISKWDSAGEFSTRSMFAKLSLDRLHRPVCFLAWKDSFHLEQKLLLVHLGRKAFTMNVLRTRGIAPKIFLWYIPCAGCTRNRQNISLFHADNKDIIGTSSWAYLEVGVATLQYFMTSSGGGPFQRRQQILAEHGLVSIMWLLWKERNRRIFNQKKWGKRTKLILLSLGLFIRVLQKN